MNGRCQPMDFTSNLRTANLLIATKKKYKSASNHEKKLQSNDLISNILTLTQELYLKKVNIVVTSQKLNRARLRAN
jgi:isochorismate hydrolase